MCNSVQIKLWTPKIYLAYSHSSKYSLWEYLKVQIAHEAVVVVIVWLLDLQLPV